MMKYAFYVITSKSGDEGQGNTQIDNRSDRQTNLIVHTGRHTVIDTTHIIGLVFSRRIIQLELWRKKQPLNINDFFTTTIVLYPYHLYHAHAMESTAHIDTPCYHLLKIVFIAYVKDDHLLIDII